MADSAWPVASEIVQILTSSGWMASGLGPIETWPQILRTVVDLILPSRVPIALAWGSSATLLYNDAYARLLGPRHPSDLGRSIAGERGDVDSSEKSPERLICTFCSSIDPAADVSCSPIRDENGKMVGALAILAQTGSHSGAASRRIAERLGVDRVLFVEIHGSNVVILQDAAASHALANLSAGIIETLRRGGTLVVNDTVTHPGFSETDRQALMGLQIASCLMVAQMRKDGRVAAVWACSETPRAWTSFEIELFQDTASRLWAESGPPAAKDAARRAAQHRLKNTLQLIASLINLQANEFDDRQALAAFQKTRDRVHCVAGVHEFIYSSQEHEAIDMAALARRLVPELVAFYDCGERVKVSVQGGGATLPVDKAVPFGLLVHELVSNSCRHAFPARSRGEISVQVGRDGERNVLSVVDTGIGIPPEMNLEGGAFLGFRLIQMFVRQLGGQLRILPGPGANVQVRFPASRPSEENCL